MTVFGEVADTYDQVRPGYPDEIVAALLAYHGGVPDRIVELGAGTGKATEVLLRTGAPITCVEPDARMAAVLSAKFPQVDVHRTTFERWTPPAGGVPVIACAMAWHWLDPATRARRAHDALRPGGTLAVVGHTYGYTDPALADAIDTALRGIDPSVQEREPGWFRADIAAAGLFTDLTTEELRRRLDLPKERYLQLLRTFGPYRVRSPEARARALQVVGETVDRFGGTVGLDLPTTLVLARRPR